MRKPVSNSEKVMLFLHNTEDNNFVVKAAKDIQSHYGFKSYYKKNKYSLVAEYNVENAKEIVSRFYSIVNNEHVSSNLADIILSLLVRQKESSKHSYSNSYELGQLISIDGNDTPAIVVSLPTEPQVCFNGRLCYLSEALASK